MKSAGGNVRDSIKNDFPHYTEVQTSEESHSKRLLSYTVSCSLMALRPTSRALFGVAFNTLWICRKRQKVPKKGPPITPSTETNFSVNLPHCNRGRQSRKNSKDSVKCPWPSICQARTQCAYTACVGEALLWIHAITHHIFRTSGYLFLSLNTEKDQKENKQTNKPMAVNELLYQATQNRNRKRQ